MRALTYLISLLFLLSQSSFGQQNTIVTANSNEISDHLDLRAVASIFGESEDLSDFERRLNDPSLQISNIDLNQDNEVDYLRVAEIYENNIHLIVIQSVIGHELFQDIATIEVEKESRNQNVHIQIVGNSFFYGNNYIYEPVYVRRPIIVNYFWRPNYVVYYSPWYWGYYPTYFYTWHPYPVYRYHAHIGYYIGYNNHCNFVNHRRNPRFASVYNNHYRGAYERQHPNRSFNARNTGYTNRYEMRENNRNRSGRTSVTNENRYTNRSTAMRSNSRQTNRNNNESAQIRSNTRPSVQTRNTQTRNGSNNDSNQNRSSSRPVFAQNRVKNSSNDSERVQSNDRNHQNRNTNLSQRSNNTTTSKATRPNNSNSRSNSNQISRSSTTRG